MKKDEIAKPGKYPRMIGDLGVAASLQAFTLVAMLKHAMADHPYELDNATIEFCISPNPEKLRHIFAKLINPPKTYYFVYFSDDASFAARHNGRVYVYNLDISSCDASHTSSVFNLLTVLTPDPHKSEMERLVAQCKLPIIVHNVDDRTQFVKLKPKSHRLYSGSTITTFVNNVANILIALMVIKDEAYQPASIVRAAMKAGYVVTVQACQQIEDIQFLKHSPVIDSQGILRAMLNLGVLLRSTGQCKGDLPGRGPIGPRASAFQHGFLRGMYPRTTFTLLTNMLAACRVHSISAHDNEYSITAGDTYHVNDLDLYRRYRLTQYESELLNNDLGHASYQNEVANTAIDKILAVDYGLSVVYL